MANDYLDVPELSDDTLVELDQLCTFEYKVNDKWIDFKDFFITLDEEYGFTLDACASESNHLCEKYYTVKQNALTLDWSGEVVWCNPWYNSMFAHWVWKCHEESLGGAKVVLLAPFKPEDAWWRYADPYKTLEIEGRCLMPGAVWDGVTMKCAVIIFGELNE